MHIFTSCYRYVKRIRRCRISRISSMYLNILLHQISLPNTTFVRLIDTNPSISIVIMNSHQKLINFTPNYVHNFSVSLSFIIVSNS